MLLRRLGRVVLSAWFYALLTLFTAVAVPLFAVFLGLFQAVTWSQRRTMRRFRRAISLYGNVCIRVLPWPFIRASFVDDEPGAPREACLFVCNHPSASDPFLMAFLPYECVQVAKSWPFRLPVLGPFAKWAGYLDVERLSHEEFAGRAAALLGSGVCVIAFPEATRSGTGPIGAFHGSVFRIALATGVPIVPICITGNEEIPPKGSLVLRPGRVLVRKLAALRADEYRGLTPFQLKSRVRAQLIAAGARGE